MKEMWNQRYAEHELVYGEAPNTFLKAFIDREEPGSILLPAEGEGRNAVYAASMGWEVFAMDFSTVAQEKALRRARQRGLALTYEVADITSWEFDRQVDLVALIFAHLAPENRKAVHRKLTGYLKPGGTMLLQAFSRDQIKYNSGGPKNIDWLYSPEMLRDDFRNLKIEMLEAKTEDLDESRFHQGKAGTIRMIARKIKN